ncbi:MAG: hypothetical protein J7502_17945 [Flavisolibacter sp.]|nr:hypothetical protein [Flavisolibacter sp.]
MQTQFITDTNGKKISAVLPIKKYQMMLEQLDELACIKAYDKAKAKKKMSFVALDEAFRQVEKNRKK